MNIEKSLDIIKGKLLMIDKMLKQDQEEGHGSSYEMQKEDFEAIETLLTAYEKEKEKNKKINEFCRKELAFERRLKRENREPDEFNQGRFYVSENIRKIIEEE